MVVKLRHVQLTSHGLDLLAPVMKKDRYVLGSEIATQTLENAGMHSYISNCLKLC
jgi:hypothetical protein